VQQEAVYKDWYAMPKDVQQGLLQAKFQLMDRIGVRLSRKDKANPGPRVIEWVGEPRSEKTADQYHRDHMMKATGWSDTRWADTAKKIVELGMKIDTYCKLLDKEGFPPGVQRNKQEEL
jgi:hypothetical protein